MMRNFHTLLLILLSVNTFSQHSTVNDSLTDESKALYENLHKISDSDFFIFGQEWANSFKNDIGLSSDPYSSDCKDVVGDHPGVLGADFHYIITKSTDEANIHIQSIKAAYSGFSNPTGKCVITFDYHMFDLNYTFYINESNTDFARKVVDDEDLGNGQKGRQWLYNELDRVITIINDSLVADGKKIPIVFRMFHEQNGDWFWWCTGGTTLTDEKYKTLFQISVNYIKERTNSVLFAWSPNTRSSNNEWDTYPGDDYVDVIGLDSYEVGDNVTLTKFRETLGMLADEAESRGKVVVVSETGYRSDNGNYSSTYAQGQYWMDFLSAILNDTTVKTKKIAWVLTWINGGWNANPYLPTSTSPETAINYFKSFYDSPVTLFAGDMNDIYNPGFTLPTSVPEIFFKADKAIVYPAYAVHSFSIKASENIKRVEIINLNGISVFDSEGEGIYQTISVENLQKGMYFVRISFDKYYEMHRIIK